MRVRGALLLAVVGALALLLPDALAKDALPRVKRSPEFRYVDATDDAEAAEALAKLVQKYDTPKRCEALLKILRTKRAYPGRMPSQMTLDHLCVDGKSRQFTYLMPSRYSKRKPTGVLFFLHGAVSQPPPGGGANEARMFAPAVDRLNLLVVGPSTYQRVEWGAPGCRDLIRHALDFVKTYFNVDENRVYLAGDSDGGRGTYRILETEATCFASAVPVIGAPGGVSRFPNLKNIPFLAINGATDSLFKVDEIRPLMDAMTEYGTDLRFEVVEGKGHDPRLFLEWADEVCDFFEAHPREPYPTTVRWSVDTSQPTEQDFPSNTFRWVRIDACGAGASGTLEALPGTLRRGNLARIEAVRDGNRIEVQTSGVTRFTVLLSDEMVDLEEEIVVTANGTEVFRGIVAPDATAILEEARRFKDRRLVFVNRVTIDL